jgi:uncharacterized phage-associated protein
MQNAINYAKYFIKNGMDSSPNTFDGNMKLQKMLVFADLINLAENGIRLFDEDVMAFQNGCVVESVRLQYRNNYSDLKSESDNYEPVFTAKEQEVLDITIQIFGKLSAVELSELNHQFDFWKKSYKNGIASNGFHNKEESIVRLEDMQLEINKMRKVLESYKKTNEDIQAMEVVNGVTFYYNPKEITVDDAMLDELQNFSFYADEDSYNIYLDDGKLVIF